MELRKIQRTSGGSFFVCLPKIWAKKNGINRGSIVSVFESTDGRLSINPKYDVERSPRVSIIKPSPLLDREIVEKYLLGSDVIRVETKKRISPMDREVVKRALHRLVGLEIVEEDYSKIVMQSLLEPSTFPPEKILRREYSIASSMHRDAVTALVENDMQLAKNVISRDNEVNRLYFLLVRILRTVIQNPRLSEKLGILPIDCLDYRLVASFVESIGDQSVEISEETMKLDRLKIKKNLTHSLLQLHEIAYESHENAIAAIFSRDISIAESVRTNKDTVSDLFRDIELHSRTESAEISSHIRAIGSSISRIYANSLDIADLVMPRLL